LIAALQQKLSFGRMPLALRAFFFDGGSRVWQKFMG
jgi:hypothetical protein